jgi:hypothetical protein
LSSEQKRILTEKNLKKEACEEGKKVELITLASENFKDLRSL